MKHGALLAIAMLFPGAALAVAPADGSAQPGQAAPPALSAAYLQGRWCETSGSGWMSFDTVTRQINLPNGNTGRRVVGTYTMAGSELAIVGPTGNRITATLRRVDRRSMHFVYGQQSSLVRRC